MDRQLTRALLLLLLTTLALPAAVRAQQVVTVRDGDISAGQTVNWTRDHVYLLDGFVFAEEGATLNIEAGTVIQGKSQPTTGDRASTLIVTRGARIYANGTPAQPIVFTAEGDDPANPNDLPHDATGRWGGVILLGRATTNRATTGQIEGLPETETRGAYGGTSDDDNSGVFRYVSIRHGGAVIGANNEINGLTLGAVGRATTVEYVEVFRNQDDGFEWFGGMVDVRYLVSAFNDDDGFDYDEGWRGRGQFWFLLMAEEVGDSGAEMDGGTTPEDGQPFATPTIYNATYIGRGAAAGTSNRALRFRDNAGGRYYNSIFTDFGSYFLSVEDLISGEDSQARLSAGELALQHNVVYGFQRGNQAAELVTVESSDDVTAGRAVDNRAGLGAYLGDAANANVLSDPMLTTIGRSVGAALDPRPMAGSPALTAARKAYTDAYFTPVDYVGAFGNRLWIADWTMLAQAGYLTTASATDREGPGELPSAVTLSQNYPNPFNPSTAIAYTLERTQPVRLSVYDLMGREVAVLVDGVQPAGAFEAAFDGSALASGLYLYRLATPAKVITHTMVLLK